MTSVGEPTAVADSDWRTIVRAGVQLGVVTAVGVVFFALLSRAMVGTTEIIVQSVLVLVGAAVLPTYRRCCFVHGTRTASLGLR